MTQISKILLQFEKILKKDEIALASALAIAGNALGMGLGYVVPSLIVTDFNLNATHCDNCINDVTNQSSGDTSTLKNQLLVLVSISTGISILNLVGMVIIYDRVPGTSRQQRRAQKKYNFHRVGQKLNKDTIIN